MPQTTLCYIEHDNQYLMLHRNKKENDLNYGKWIGVGGKLEEDESPDECLLREVKEETGLTILDYDFRGVITFCFEHWETEYMYVFTATEFEGDLIENCPEGDLKWINKDEILALDLWDGDKLFLPLLRESQEFFSLKLVYDAFDHLISSDMKKSKDTLKRLLAFERMYKELIESQEKIVDDMDVLKARGRTNSATYRQLMGKKLTNQSMLSMLEIYVGPVS